MWWKERASRRNRNIERDVVRGGVFLSAGGPAASRNRLRPGRFRSTLRNLVTSSTFPALTPLAKGDVVYTTGLFSLVDGLVVRPRCCSVVCASYRGRACSATLESGDAAGNPSAASDMRNARRLHLAGLRGRGIAMKVSRGKWRAGLWTCKRKGMWKAAARWKGATP